MKKILKYILIITLVFIIFPINANAKTLGQLKSEYNALEKKYSDKNSEIKNNKAQQSSTKARIEGIYTELEEAETEVRKLNDDIKKLNEDISKKNEEVQELMRFFQASEGESTYLEYIFKAKSITDFIYRLSVSEQLSTYNNKLIDDMNKMIVKNKENIKKLNDKQKELEALRTELKEKLVVLAEEEEVLAEEGMNIQKEIEESKKIIDFYINSGCSESQDISTCAHGKIPPGSKWWRPMSTGYMTSTWYSDVLSGGSCRRHAGVDIGAATGVNVYSAADGLVVTTGDSGDGYGYKVVINHTINGQDFTTLYGHLSAILVSEGQVVTKDTVIGLVGNTGHSFGSHLHFNVCRGLVSCISWGTTADPGDYVNFPPNKHYIYDRDTMYSGYFSDECGWLR